MKNEIEEMKKIMMEGEISGVEIVITGGLLFIIFLLGVWCVANIIDYVKVLVGN